MSVKPDTLETPEADLALSNRKKKGRADESAKDLAALKERLEKAKLHPAHDRAKILKHDHAPHCGECFARGWAAAVRAIGGG